MLAVLVFAVLVAGIVFSVPVFAETHKAKWTILVYIDADNNLEPNAFLDVEELEKIGSTQDIKVVFILDRSPKNYEAQAAAYIPGIEAYGDWSGTRIYLAARHPGPGIGSKLLKDLGEVDMGDPSTLRAFVEYAVEMFPAEHYMLVLWNHGSGFGVAYDDSSGGDGLTLDELRSVLEQLGAEGIRFDIVGFDACLMATLETLSSVAGLTDYVVASEELEPGYGWPLDSMLEILVSNPSISPRELLAGLVKAYGEFYESRGMMDTTLSAFDMRELSRRDIVEGVKSLAAFTLQHPSVMQAVRSRIDEYGALEDTGGVTVDYVQLVREAAKHGLSGAAVALADKLVEARIANYAGPGKAESNGVAIFYPRKNLVEAYNRLTSFGSETGWSKALAVAVNIEPEISENPSVSGDVETSNAAAAGEGASLVSALGRLNIDKRPGDELVAVLAAEGQDADGSVMVASYVAVGLRDGRLVKLVDKVVEKAENPEDFLLPVLATSYDADRDGVEDVYVADQLYLGSDGIPETHVFRINPSTGKVVVTGSIGFFEVSGLAVADLDGDGHAELVVAGTRYEVDNEGYLTDVYGAIYVVDAVTFNLVGKFKVSSGQEGVLTSISGVAVVNASGRLYLAVGVNHYDTELSPLPDMDTVYVYRYRGNKLDTVMHIPYSSNDLDAGDVTGDGAPELIAASSQECSATIFTIDVGRARYGEYATIQFPASICDTVQSVSVFDLDGDGVNEAIFMLGVLDEEGVLDDLNMRVFSFVDRPRLELRLDHLFTGSTAKIPLALDMDGDGRLEVAYVAFQGKGLRVELHSVTNYVETKGSLRGRVVDENGQGVPDATVTVSVPRQSKVYTTVTDDKGSFELRNIPATTYEVLAVTPSGEVGLTSASVKPGKTSQVTVRVSKLQQSSEGEETTTTTTSTETATTSTASPTSTTTTSQEPTTTTHTTTHTQTTTTHTTQTGTTASPTTSSQQTSTAGRETTTRTSTHGDMSLTLPIPITTQSTATGKETSRTSESQSTTEEASTQSTETITPSTSPASPARRSSGKTYYVLPAIALAAAIAYIAIRRKEAAPPAPPPPPPA
ncbi:hypothetical protein PYJP_06730 [Pyrofollis japonicus]|nr:hypothetical protein PYJP_06730 [Pyrofollis japonicus]